MQVQRFDPFTVLARMGREFDELVRRGWGGGVPGQAAGAMAGFVPAVELLRDGDRSNWRPATTAGCSTYA